MSDDRILVDEDYSGETPSGSRRLGYVTYTEKEPYMVELLRGFIIQKAGFPSYETERRLVGYPTLGADTPSTPSRLGGTRSPLSGASTAITSTARQSSSVRCPSPSRLTKMATEVIEWDSITEEDLLTAVKVARASGGLIMTAVAESWEARADYLATLRSYASADVRD